MSDPEDKLKQKYINITKGAKTIHQFSLMSFTLIILSTKVKMV